MARRDDDSIGIICLYLRGFAHAPTFFSACIRVCATGSKIDDYSFVFDDFPPRVFFRLDRARGPGAKGPGPGGQGQGAFDLKPQSLKFKK